MVGTAGSRTGNRGLMDAIMVMAMDMGTMAEAPRRVLLGA